MAIITIADKDGKETTLDSQKDAEAMDFLELRKGGQNLDFAQWLQAQEDFDEIVISESLFEYVSLKAQLEELNKKADELQAQLREEG